LPSTLNENVLVGFATSDDAGVYKLKDDLALVQTVDFFTPIVDDPFDFGRIAAANALSDIYAMGAKPITALNIAAFPTEVLHLDILAKILEGGAVICKQANVAILGGHTIKDSEPKYGLAVTGTVDPRAVVTNANARPGDFLLLTKQLGTGILATALKRGHISAQQMQPAIDSMAALNERASIAMIARHAHAATDITGFGLLGHANEMARGSGVALTLSAAALPLFAGVLELIARDILPGGTRDNALAHEAYTTFDESIPQAVRFAFSDAQTSGGLLISLTPDDAHRLQHDLQTQGIPAAIVGRVEAGSGITVSP
jgi:selenide,water dikinase